MKSGKGGLRNDYFSDRQGPRLGPIMSPFYGIKLGRHFREDDSRQVDHVMASLQPGEWSRRQPFPLFIQRVIALDSIRAIANATQLLLMTRI